MSLQHILLGLLRQDSGSGYDLNKRLQEWGQHFWTTDQSQIYRALYKMQDFDWVTFETIIQEDSPNKKVYHITDDGAEELKRWLSEAIDESQPNSIWLAQIFLGEDIDEASIRRLLNHRLKKVCEFRDWVRLNHDSIQNKNATLPTDKLRILSYDYKLHMLDIEQKWLEQTLNNLQSMFTP